MAAFDLVPTQPLRGPHLRGLVRRRFLASYPVPPEALQDAIPPGGRLVVRDGMAWVSACFVRLEGMRPAGVPKALGLGFHYLVHRTMAFLPFPDGVARRSVLILEASVDSAAAVTFGRAAGVRFRRRRLALQPDRDGERITMHDGDELLLDLVVHPRPPEASRFGGADDADGFIAGVAYGAQWQPPRLRLYAETHDPWRIGLHASTTHRNAFLEPFGAGEADHVIAMADVPHYFALRPATVAVGRGAAPSRPAASGPA